MRLRYRWVLAVSTCLGLMALGAPSAVNAYKRWQTLRHRASLAELLSSPVPGESEDWLEKAELKPEKEARGRGPVEEETDDALRRVVATRLMMGNPRPEISAEFARIARAEATKWAHLLPRPPRSKAQAAVASAPVGGLSWVNLGPTDANFEFNGVQYPQVDSGRPNDVRVNPQDPNTAYLATSGGGIWKTFDFQDANPSWFPITEGLGNIAIGAMDMDPNAPDTLYAGTGDFVDVAGGQLLKTTDGGATWSAPASLSGIYGSGLSAKAQRIRTIRVDPANSQIVLVGTDVGLFRSTDGGASFALIDLPNAGTQVAENVWSLAYTGNVGGVSRWAVSGVQASAPGVAPPSAGFGTASTPGDIWISTDAGASWSSCRAAGTLPTTAVGRVTLAAGTPSSANPPVTTLYAQLGSVDDTTPVGYWRSDDSGNSFVDATGTLGNPTNDPTDCGDVFVGNGQIWYNQAIAVDPADDNRVIVGGQLCGLRTRNGKSSSPVWENVSHWLPTTTYNIGVTAAGLLPYVHADWHTVLILRTATGYKVLVGSDGGLFVSTNVFDPDTINDSTVTWAFPNRGIVTHLAYAVASGDPVTGNPFLSIMGLQDNGTRWRDGASDPTTFNQVIGGDGIGTTTVTSGSPALTVNWASVDGFMAYCTPSTSGDCNNGNNWGELDVPVTCAGDGEIFFTRYAPVITNTTGPTAITISARQVFRITGDPNAGATWQAISPCFNGTVTGAPNTALRQVFASPTIDGLYGVPTNSGKFLVTNNCQSGSTSACTWKWSNSTGFDLNGDSVISSSEKIFGTTSIAFPPTTPAGKNPGDVYLGASGSPSTAAGTPVPPALGRLFLTQDGGTTWTPLHGNGTGFDLPNVPIAVVRYDPGDLTNNTIYVGCDLGLYRTTDGGQTWQRFGYGLPMVKVTDIFIGQAGNLMRISTYGRGVWEIYPSATAEKGVNGNGDFDRNQQIDFVDLAAMSARLGTDPTTTTSPYYEWNLDMVGSYNAIDESDLSQLLTRYGGRP